MDERVNEWFEGIEQSESGSKSLINAGMLGIITSYHSNYYLGLFGDPEKCIVQRVKVHFYFIRIKAVAFF